MDSGLHYSSKQCKDSPPPLAAYEKVKLLQGTSILIDQRLESNRPDKTLGRTSRHEWNLISLEYEHHGAGLGKNKEVIRHDGSDRSNVPSRISSCPFCSCSSYDKFQKTFYHARRLWGYMTASGVHNCQFCLKQLMYWRKCCVSKLLVGAQICPIRPDRNISNQMVIITDTSRELENSVKCMRFERSHKK